MDIIQLIVLIIAGILLGVLGAIIGSTLLVLVPLLNFFGLPIHTAIGTGKISVLSREIIPIFHFRKHKLINFRITIPFIISGAAFSFIGAKVILNLDEKVATIIVALFMIIISLVIFMKRDAGLNEKKIKFSNKTLVLSIVLGALIGFYEGLFGGGANVFIIFSFVFLFGNTFLKAVANSKVPNLLFAFVSSLPFIISGYIDWFFAIPLMISTAIGSFFGARLAIKKGDRFIKMLFVALVIIMAVKLLFFS